MICDFVAVGTRAWQAGASKAGRAQSTPGLFDAVVILLPAQW
jgi:hypothetical protein